jgi:hypothetical protein
MIRLDFIKTIFITFTMPYLRVQKKCKRNGTRIARMTRIELSGVHQKGFCLILVKNQISKERSSPMKEGKYQKQKPQIRVNPPN